MCAGWLVHQSVTGASLVFKLIDASPGIRLFSIDISLNREIGQERIKKSDPGTNEKIPDCIIHSHDFTTLPWNLSLVSG